MLIKLANQDLKTSFGAITRMIWEIWLWFPREMYLCKYTSQRKKPLLISIFLSQDLRIFVSLRKTWKSDKPELKVWFQKHTLEDPDKYKHDFHV